MKTEPLLAHSARESDGQTDKYKRHVEATVKGARQNCEEMLQYAEDGPDWLLDNVLAAATFHDLGKLDCDNQAVLHGKRKGRLPWDHIDAGVAHLKHVAPYAAWLVRAHHSPGLPSKPYHRTGRKLRGRRNDDPGKVSSAEHTQQIERTDSLLAGYLGLHERELGKLPHLKSRKVKHGLEMRLALSCLVDADHADTCFFDSGQEPPSPVAARWEVRLRQLIDYVESFPRGDSETEVARNRARREFFDACLSNSETAHMYSCEGPVGIGKTTAVTAFLLRLAIRDGLRRIIVVAPFTNILTQTARTLRKALVLPDEEAISDQVVVEQHHRADFSTRDARAMASLWNAPIVLTTAVSFFETLSSRHPGALRKLHYLPGSAIFLDEAHAAIPVSLWPQNWLWLRQLTNRWRCRVALASGTLTRFWEDDEIVGNSARLPELLPSNQKKGALTRERRRVQYRSLNNAESIDVRTLSRFVTSAPGPRLVILNTVQNAAIVAQHLRDELKHSVYHLSTALTPDDRGKIYDLITCQLEDRSKADWTLVATSCVEAGVDFSFRTAFRERFSVASILQVGGRVNRNSEHDDEGGSVVHAFSLSDTDVTYHPAARTSERILRTMLEDDSINRLSPSEAATVAMKREINETGGFGRDQLRASEAKHDYPAAQEAGRVICADTHLVVVDGQLKKKVRNREKLNYRELLNGSVQLWTTKIRKLAMEPFPHVPQAYEWNDTYDAEFLGIMDGILRQRPYENGGGVI